MEMCDGFDDLCAVELVVVVIVVQLEVVELELLLRHLLLGLVYHFLQVLLDMSDKQTQIVNP